MLLDPSVENRLVETGTNLGTTTMLLAQAIIDSGRRGHVDTIEISPEIHREAARRFALAGLENVITPHMGDSLRVLAELTDDGPTFAAAFLDGNHFHDHVVSEFELVHRFVRRDGAIFFDNTGLISEGDETRV